MATIGVFGATGFTGSLLVRTLLDAGNEVVAAARNPDKLAKLGGSERLRTTVASVDDPTSLYTLAESCDVLLSTVGPFTELGRPAFQAALDTGTHYADSTGEQPFVRWVNEHHERAVAAGVCAVPAAGYDYVPGDLLASLALQKTAKPTAVHITYFVRGRGGPMAATSRGTRKSIIRMLTEPTLVLDAGEVREEGFGETRRLAYFPRPVGPRHAVALPGTEMFSVARGFADVSTIRTYLAMPSWMAEVAQASSLLGRFTSTRSALTRLATGLPEPSERARRAVQFAVVAEAHGDDGVVRAWMTGHDVYGFTAHAMTTIAGRLAAGPAHLGVQGPSMVSDAESTADELSKVADIRWGVIAPER